MSSNDEVNEQPRSALNQIIRSAHGLLDRTVQAAKKHSPLNEHKLQAADDAVAGVIHHAYHAVKRIAVNGNPVVILSSAAVLGAAPSVLFGPRATIRNAGLALAMASVMIYPDHIRRYFAAQRDNNQ